LSDCHRLLGKDGVLRISTPNLRHLAEGYLANDISAWAEQGWKPETPARFLNEALRLWGHQFVCDREELHLLSARSWVFVRKGCRLATEQTP